MMDYGIVAKNIRAELKAYIQKSGLKALVLGISGGIDSTVCAALALPVCKELGIPLIGRSLTIGTNKDDEIIRSQMVGKTLCTDFKYVDLTETYNTFIQDLDASTFDPANESDTARKIRMGNVKARMRMIYIYDIAQYNKGMVLSTDNYTELMLGFWTLHGDVGDYGMVQNLWKMEVYELSTWIAENEYGVDTAGYDAIMECVKATPTDGLGITSSDVEQLGAKNYAEVDAILKEELLNGGGDHTVAKRKRASEFKRNNPLNLLRDTICAGAEQ
jgi:NAD+ synthetase